MGKRRYDAKKIAKSPLLKKRMAKFCAEVAITWELQKVNDYKEILFAGHRGYISYSEDDLCKEFDKKLEILRDRYSKLKASEDKKRNDRWFRPDPTFDEITMWYEEGVEIANEVFEEQFLA